MANTAAAVIGLVVVMWLAWLAINLFDVPLTPAARAMLATPHNPYPPHDNLYVAFVGFTAPAGQSMLQTGQARIAAYNRENGSGESRGAVTARPSTAATGSPPAPALAVNVEVKDWQHIVADPWSGAKVPGHGLDDLLTANADLYQRYLALHRLPSYFQTAQPGPASPAAYIPPPLQQLFLAQAARMIQAGTPSQRQQALTDVGQDLGMWRTVLDGNGDLSSKMLAAHALDVDFRFLGAMVTDPECDLNALGSQAQTLLVPFAARDWRIGDAFRWQMRAAGAMWTGLSESKVADTNAGVDRPGWLTRQWREVSGQFFKLHATENLDAVRMESLRALADDDPATFPERRQAYRDWLHQNIRIHRRWLPAYDPVGRIILDITPPEGDYIARVHDVAAAQRLVYLAYQIRARAISFDAVAAFMQQHPQWATHPIGSRPFLWNPATGTLTAEPVAAGVGNDPFRLQLVPPGQSAVVDRQSRSRRASLHRCGFFRRVRA